MADVRLDQAPFGHDVLPDPEQSMFKPASYELAPDAEPLMFLTGKPVGDATLVKPMEGLGNYGFTPPPVHLIIVSRGHQTFVTYTPAGVFQTEFQRPLDVMHTDNRAVASGSDLTVIRPSLFNETKGRGGFDGLFSGRPHKVKLGVPELRQELGDFEIINQGGNAVVINRGSEPITVRCLEPLKHSEYSDGAQVMEKQDAGFNTAATIVYRTGLPAPSEFMPDVDKRPFMQRAYSVGVRAVRGFFGR